MEKESFVFLAEGFEEIEAITVVDVLRRAGMPVKTVSITNSLQVKGAHGVTVTADVLFDNTLFRNPEWLILPGGLPGAQNLADFAPLMALLKKHSEKKGRIAAICAAPAVVLGVNNFLNGYEATCYPGFEDKLYEAKFMDAPVVESDIFVTGNGPANAMAFALGIVKADRGALEAEKVAGGLLFHQRDDYGNIDIKQQDNKPSGFFG